MTVSAELRTALPSSIDPKAVRAAVRAPGSPGSLGGETWLLDLNGGLAAVYRSSIFDVLEPLVLAELAEPVALGKANELEIHRANGESFTVRPPLFEIDVVKALLAGVDGLARSGTLHEVAEPSRAEAKAKPVEPGALLDSSVQPITLIDHDVIDPPCEAEISAVIAAGEYSRADAAVAKIAEQGNLRERDEWTDLLELITSLRVGEFVAAYLWTRGVRRVPAGVHDALLARISIELELADEPILAWAAAGDGLVDDPATASRRAAFEARLGLDGPALDREVSERARRFFSDAAKADDRLAQRGLAHACLELDELDEALTWVRRAIAAEPFDFEARMLEAQILGLVAIETEDDSELIAALREVAKHFHDRPEPLVELAERLEFDDPDLAIDCLGQALEREFDEHVLLTLIELFETNGRWDPLIAKAEAALTDPSAIANVEDRLRAKLSHARSQLRVHDPGWTSSPDPQAASEVARARFTKWLMLLAVAAMIVSWLLTML